MIFGKIGSHYEQNGEKLELRQLLVIAKSNPDAYKEIKFANSNFIMGSVFCSGFCLFMLQLKFFPFNIFLSSEGKIIYDKALAVAAGFAVIGVPFVISSQIHTKKGVMIYNKGLKYSPLNNVEVKMGIISNGIGLKIRF